MNKKIHNKGFLIFLGLIVLFSIGYTLFYHFSIKPNRFKTDLFHSIKVNNAFNADDGQINNFSECVTQHLLKTYKTIDNLPYWKDFGIEDRKMTMNCIIDNLITDSINKNLYRNNLDSLMNKLWK